MQNLRRFSCWKRIEVIGLNWWFLTRLLAGQNREICNDITRLKFLDHLFWCGLPCIKLQRKCKVALRYW